MEAPQTRYAKSGDISIAYRVIGDGPRDLVIVPGYVSHVEMGGELPQSQRFLARLLTFARVVVFDKRGTGMSDPVPTVPTLEERMDDIRAVMDEAGIKRASFLAVSEGAPMALLFAASHPERCESLILAGALARSTWAPDYDYPWAPHLEDLKEASKDFLAPSWGTGDTLEVFAPSLADDPVAREWMGKLQRYGASPSMVGHMQRMFFDIDVRDVLPSIHVPTLVLHRYGDRVVNRRAGRWLADHIAGAQYVELPGRDHMLFAGDQEQVLDHIQEFITGSRGESEPDRVLATLLFTDIVGSTDQAAAMGDKKWRDVLDAHDALVAKHVEAARGRLVKKMGDGCLATFDGPGRAIRCAQTLTNDVRSLGVQIRAGLHTGEIEMRGSDIGGIAVHIASRVSGQAGAGEVVVSSTVKDLVAGSGIGFEDRGMHELKGVPDQWHLYSVQ